MTPMELVKMARMRAPQFPEEAPEGVIVRWHKHPGDQVESDDVVVDIELEEAVLVQVPAVFDGVLEGTFKKLGDPVVSDEVLAIITTA